MCSTRKFDLAASFVSSSVYDSLTWTSTMGSAFSIQQIHSVRPDVVKFMSDGTNSVKFGIVNLQNEFYHVENN